MDLMDEIEFYIGDEDEAYKTYSRMAGDADDAGMHKTAQILRGMAADELRHKEMLEGMYYRPEFGPVRQKTKEEVDAFFYETIFGKRPEEEHRLFPQTYSDWVNLAEDIKTKLPEIDWPIINTDLNIIAGNYPGDIDDAKRRLVEKAGKLGIR